ncbi:MAG: hypothetical protein M0Q21_00585 [Ignavibacteriaceae bacterium]|nr:hypothetical protein [Ignavibacteriaceae bacterium]
MKKALSLLIVLVLFAGFTNGQSKITLGVGGTVALPMGTFADASSMGFGGLVRGEMGFGTIVGTASLGYLSFPGKDISEDQGSGVTTTYSTSFSAIPILVGAKYSFAPGFYGSLEAGLNMLSWEAKWETKVGGVVYPAGSGSTTGSETKFGFALGVGYQMSPFDISLKYQNLGTPEGGDALNFIGVNVLYCFGI